jgi:NAD(P)-dependent dehydrogenase (short-subunit alcohol dehydrogenase family)
MTSVALVIGANRGIGLEVTRQLAQQGMAVILGSRDLKKGEDAAKRFEDEGFDVRPHALDVTDEKTIDKALRYVEEEYGRLDVLINNAAIHYDTWQHATDADLEVVHEALETNLLGPWRMSQAFLPLLRRSEYARIVSVSSGAGSLANMGAGTPA